MERGKGPRMPRLVFCKTQLGGREIFFGKPVGSHNHWGRVERVCPTVMVGIGFRVLFGEAPRLILKVKPGGFVSNTWTSGFEPDWEEVVA